MSEGLIERLERGPVICAEGYLFELERRGYVQAGPFVPEVVLDHPEVVAQLHRDFVHAGSDVVEAFTYYAHREKMRIVGKEHLLEALNRQALEIAKGVAAETGALFAGDICNTNLYADDDESRRTVRGMFEEQVGWAADAGADFVIAETYSHYAEALMGLEVIKDAGLPAVVTLTVHQAPETRDGLTLPEACKRLEDAGADVVGLNCCRGPATLMPLVRGVRKAVSGHVAALPVPYRTHDAQPTFQSLRDPEYTPPGEMSFPTALDPFMCTRYEIADFAREALEIGVDYLGLCCGNGPHHIRSLAEAMSKHAYFGTEESLKAENVEFAKEL
jgi:betaine-homocysteine S-methyltransferase